MWPCCMSPSSGTAQAEQAGGSLQEWCWTLYPAIKPKLSLLEAKACSALLSAVVKSAAGVALLHVMLSKYCSSRANRRKSAGMLLVCVSCNSPSLSCYGLGSACVSVSSSEQRCQCCPVPRHLFRELLQQRKAVLQERCTLQSHGKAVHPCLVLSSATVTRLPVPFCKLYAHHELLQHSKQERLNHAVVTHM